MSYSIQSEENYGIVVHGGAGVMSGLSDQQQLQIHKKIQETVSEAYQILQNDGSSLDAVELYSLQSTATKFFMWLRF